MDTPLSTEGRFKTNFVTLVEICEEMVHEGDRHNVSGLTPTMFSILKILVKTVNPVFLIERFIRKTSDHWDKIHTKDIDYFKTVAADLFNIVENNGIGGVIDQNEKLTSGLKLSHISMFKDLISGSYKDENDETVMIFDDERVTDTWKIMHSFVKQSLLFIHTKRKMVGGNYTVSYFSNVNVKENAEKWKVRKIIRDDA
jgi:hypothetical protein